MKKEKKLESMNDLIEYLINEKGDWSLSPVEPSDSLEDNGGLMNLCVDELDDQDMAFFGEKILSIHPGSLGINNRREGIDILLSYQHINSKGQ